MQSALAALAALIAILPLHAAAPEDRSGLTRASFRRNCLLCHSGAAPEGISSAIMSGLHATSPLKPAQAMPGVLCWRRCEACKVPEASAARR